MATDIGESTSGQRGAGPEPPQAADLLRLQAMRIGKFSWVLFVSLILLLAALALEVIFLRQESGVIVMSSFVVVGVGVFMTLLFVGALGFKAMGLANENQALGLPEGSIRAMIALILIVVFVLFGISLFQTVGYGWDTDISRSLTKAELDTVRLSEYGTRRIAVVDLGKGNYIIRESSPVNQDGVRLAQQLLTTVGTLVVAVSSFYFGSAALGGAAKPKGEETIAGAGGKEKSIPTIGEVDPKEGKKTQPDQPLSLKIKGKGFSSPKSVSLQRGGEKMNCSEITSSDTLIRCSLVVDMDPADELWELVVENEDGGVGKLANAFKIV